MALKVRKRGSFTDLSPSGSTIITPSVTFPGSADVEIEITTVIPGVDYELVAVITTATWTASPSKSIRGIASKTMTVHCPDPAPWIYLLSFNVLFPPVSPPVFLPPAGSHTRAVKTSPVWFTYDVYS
jgi:hypothetical protein